MEAVGGSARPGSTGRRRGRRPPGDADRPVAMVSVTAGGAACAGRRRRLRRRAAGARRASGSRPARQVAQAGQRRGVRCHRRGGSGRRWRRHAWSAAGRPCWRPGVVGDDQQGLRRRRRSANRPQDLAGGVAVEVAGRLVGQDHQRLVDQRPGHGDALALAAREPVGQVPARSPTPSRSSSSGRAGRRRDERRRAARAARRSRPRSARRPGGTPGTRTRSCGAAGPPRRSRTARRPGGRRAGSRRRRGRSSPPSRWSRWTCRSRWGP